MSIINFTKMHGCGNDFVIIDQRDDKNIVFSQVMIQKIANRRYSVGCDQLILLKHSKQADCFMQIYNADGSEAGACGNASRCVAKLIASQIHKENIAIQTIAGVLYANVNKNELVTIDIGLPSFTGKDLLLTEEVNSLELNESFNNINLDAAAINVGNVHIVFFYDHNINDFDLEKLSLQVKNMGIFLEEVNISIVNINNDTILIRTWERGVGETLCCGTAACAATVLSIKKAYINNRCARVCSSGGDLYIEWQDNNHIFMTGDANISFTGQIEI